MYGGKVGHCSRIKDITTSWQWEGMMCRRHVIVILKICIMCGLDDARRDSYLGGESIRRTEVEVMVKN